MSFTVETSGLPLRWDYILGRTNLLLNVSEDYDGQAYRKCSEHGIIYNWFPMNERGSEIGLNSLIGALCLLDTAKRKGWNVIVHCVQGQNRSVSVVEAFKWMCEDFDPSFATPQLDKNCDGVRLPRKGDLKEILGKLKKHLSYPGGFHSWLDFIKQK